MSYSVADLGVTVGFPCKISCGHLELHVAGSVYSDPRAIWTEKCSLETRKRSVPLSLGRAIWFNCTGLDKFVIIKSLIILLPSIVHVVLWFDDN